MTVEVAESSLSLVHIVISLAVLLFAAKLFAELFHRIKLPVVLGELLAGIVVGPFALGGLPIFNGEPLVELEETVKHIGEIAAIVILFIAGLEITPREFLKGGAASFTVGSLGVVVPFFVGFYVFLTFGLGTIESMLVATALTATSIAITVQVLTELGKMQTKEARLILGARYCRRYSCYSRLVCGYDNGTDRRYYSCHYRYYGSNLKNSRIICSTSYWICIYYPKNTS